MALATTGIDKFDWYTSEVVNGRLDVCKWVKFAVDRHYRDMDRQRTEDFPYYFESKACMHYVNFFEKDLQHFDGIFDGEPIIFEPWQYFSFGSPFGWISEKRIKDHPIRRFNESIVMISKKQGKSTIKAGESLYMMMMDGHPSAQCYIVAINATHAKTLAYRDATLLVKNHEQLNEMLRINKSAADLGIYNDHDDSFFKPITSDSKKVDGPKIHYCLLEEIKDIFDLELYETIKNGTAADPTAMISNISTAGSNMTSLGYERQEYAEKILTGEIDDNQTFAVIYTIDKEDRANWYDLSVVKKANPNFGVSVQSNYYEQRIKKAKTAERKKNDFLTKHLGVWINAMDNFFTMEKWMDIGKKHSDLKLEDFFGQPCYMFLDLASRQDICSAYLLFPYGKNRQGKNRYVTFGHNFLPAQVVSEDLVGHRADYNAWAEMGLFTLTPGNTTDYDVLENHVEWVYKKFKLMDIRLDKWDSDYFINRLKKKRIKADTIPQTVKNISAAMKNLEAFIVNEDDNGKHDPQIVHNGDPVLAWALGNIVAKEDKNENVFWNKEHKNKKIDPAVALINLIFMEMTVPLPRRKKRRAPKVMKI